MNRYSKIKLGNTHKSRSMDFSDLQSFHENFPKNSFTPHEPNQINLKNTHLPDLQEEAAPDMINHGDTNVSGAPSFALPKLTRNGSVSSSIKSASKRFRLDNNNNNNDKNKQISSPRTTAIEGMQSVVKRAFSMRRSSSVSERYCRIHDQCVTLPSPLHDDDIDEDSDVMQTSRSVEEKKKKNKNQGYSSGRLFKACKKFLRL